jgi:hypothetical protein
MIYEIPACCHGRSLLCEFGFFNPERGPSQKEETCQGSKPIFEQSPLCA